MKIFEPMVREGYEWINCVDQADYEVFASFDGSRRAAGWKPILVVRARADEQHDFKASDFPWLGSDALVMRRAAVDALRDILDVNGELLPLATDDGVELFVLNARVIDALDEPNSAYSGRPGHPFRWHPATRSGTPGRPRSVATGSLVRAPVPTSERRDAWMVSPSRPCSSPPALSSS